KFSETRIAPAWGFITDSVHKRGSLYSAAPDYYERRNAFLHNQQPRHESRSRASDVNPSSRILGRRLSPSGKLHRTHQPLSRPSRFPPPSHRGASSGPRPTLLAYPLSSLAVV